MRNGLRKELGRASLGSTGCQPVTLGSLPREEKINAIPWITLLKVLPARLPATTATAGQGEAGPPRRGQSLRRHIAGGTSLRLRSRQASPARETPARGRASSVLLRLRPAAAAGWGEFSALVQTSAWAS